MIFSLAKMESEFFTESTSIHFKELQDNISQASDSSDSYREILSDQLNIYHTTISSKLNDIMKFEVLELPVKRFLTLLSKASFSSGCKLTPSGTFII